MQEHASYSVKLNLIPCQGPRRTDFYGAIVEPLRETSGSPEGPPPKAKQSESQRKVILMSIHFLEAKHEWNILVPDKTFVKERTYIIDWF